MSNLAAYLNQYFPADKALDNSFVNDDRDNPEEPAKGAANEKGTTKFSTRQTKDAKKKAEAEGELPSIELRTNGWTNLDLRTHFITVYGVSVRIVGAYFLFKYYVILQGKRWDSPVLADCRGYDRTISTNFGKCSRNVLAGLLSSVTLPLDGK